MLKPFRDAPAVKNVIAGQNATCDYDVGPNYYGLRFIATVTKDNATALEPTLSEAIGQIVLNVNKDPKRTMQAYELNSILMAWSSGIAATLYSKVANDLITATVDGAAGGHVQRTSTWVLDVWLAEPSRDSYAARQAFAWPTAWKNAAVGPFPANYTANIQAVITVPSGASLSNPVMRSEAMYDYKLGPVAGASGDRTPGVVGADLLAQAGIPVPAVGTPIMPITHFYRFTQAYGGTAVQLRGSDWPFANGSLQQLSIFCPANDDITQVALLLDTVPKVNATKASIEKLNRGWGWNPAYGAGTAGTDYLAVDVLHLALDFDDDPSSAISSATFKSLELDLTLSQAAAANKNLIFVAQFYRNALLL